MVIFHSYVKLPEGITIWEPPIRINWGVIHPGPGFSLLQTVLSLVLNATADLVMQMFNYLGSQVGSYKQRVYGGWSESNSKDTAERIELHVKLCG